MQTQPSFIDITDDGIIATISDVSNEVDGINHSAANKDNTRADKQTGDMIETEDTGESALTSLKERIKSLEDELNMNNETKEKKVEEVEYNLSKFQSAIEDLQNENATLFQHNGEL